MSIRIRPTIPDEKIVKLYQDHIKEKYGTVYMFLGKELQEAMKLHLTMKYGVTFNDDPKLDLLLGKISPAAHTQTILDDQEKNDLNKLFDPEIGKTKTQRAYITLNNLKRVFLDQFTHQDYSITLERLFQNSDYRTVNTNLRILLNNGSISKVNMRRGKKNRYKQLYQFTDENGYYFYNDLKCLREFIELFRLEYERSSQITLKEIRLFLDKQGILGNSEFVRKYSDVLVEKGILEQHRVRPEKGNVVFNIVG